LLQQRLDLTPENIELLSSLEKEAIRGKQIIQSLLDFSIQKEYHPETADLNQLIEAAWSKYNEDYNGSDKVELVRGFDPNLPPVSVDNKQIQQALFYLIRNAYRSMPGGGTLRIISRAVGYNVQIIISDSGPGIAQEDMRHIFEPFYQPNNQPHNMDLSITRAVIERHNGSIEVESEPGQGTTFTIHLPRL
jgi:signal transduction histidine kinase